MTDFTIVYKRFYSKITDDMYMELDEAETDALLEELLINAIPWFEFPKVNINDYDLLRQRFNNTLTNDEINILATYMVVCWIDQQLASVELIRMKYTGSDFKMTSQANHIAKLIALKKEYTQNGFHLQRLYKRKRVDKNGNIRSTFGSIMKNGAAGRKSYPVNISEPDSSCDCEDDDLAWGDFEDLRPEQNKPSNPGNSDSWEDMGDTPTSGGSGQGSWEGMEDLPSSGSGNDQGDWEGM